MTIRPGEASPTPYRLWEPSSLRLAPPGSDPADTEDETCEVVKVEIAQDGTFVGDEGSKLEGPQRLRLGIAVQREVARLSFQY